MDTEGQWGIVERKLDNDSGDRVKSLFGHAWKWDVGNGKPLIAKSPIPIGVSINGKEVDSMWQQQLTL